MRFTPEQYLDFLLTKLKLPPLNRESPSNRFFCWSWNWRCCFCCWRWSCCCCCCCCCSCCCCRMSSIENGVGFLGGWAYTCGCHISDIFRNELNMPGETDADGTNLMTCFVLVRKIILLQKKYWFDCKNCQITKYKSIIVSIRLHLKKVYFNCLNYFPFSVM